MTSLQANVFKWLDFGSSGRTREGLSAVAHHLSTSGAAARDASCTNALRFARFARSLPTKIPTAASFAIAGRIVPPCLHYAPVGLNALSIVAIARKSLSG